MTERPAAERSTAVRRLDPARPGAAADWVAATTDPELLQLSASARSISPATLEQARHILKRCNQLAAYSARQDGIERVNLSAEHKVVNQLVATWMRQVGLRTWQDPAGNLFGRIEGRQPGLPALLIGSHLDTVPDAGRYDGILGVLLAIAVAGRVARGWHEQPFALEVVGFTDEEGTRFGTALLGSRAVAGSLDNGWWQRTDARGVSLEDAFLNFGLDPAKVESAARRPEEFVGYIEAHIEQRPFLEQGDRSLGVVTGIAGARRMLVRVHGETRHAGTPYAIRKDALLMASRAITTIMDVAERDGASATVGHISVSPDAVNVVPGEAEFSLDYRASDDLTRDRGIDEIIGLLQSDAAKRSMSIDVLPTHAAATVRTAASLRSVVADAIAGTGDDRPLELFSVAGHDAMSMAALTDVAMIFIRDRGGISHNPLEAVRLEDVARALDAFEAAVLETAATYRK